MEDQQLLNRLRSGDLNALQEIYDKYKNKLLTVATCLLSDNTMAEDCLHDVFVKLATDAKVLKINRNLKNYLTTCVANRARDIWRRKSRLDVSISDIPEKEGDDQQPLDFILEGEENEKLLDAIKALPFEQREVIILHLQGSMVFKEIAKRQEISINTVQSRYRYGIEKLRKMMTGSSTL